MPRAKSDRIVTHRVELGVKEREIADSVVAAFAFNRVASPVFDLMKDVSGMIVLGGILATIYPKISLPTGADPVMEEVVEAIGGGILESIKDRELQAIENRQDVAAAENVFLANIIGKIFETGRGIL
tara:strand:- start:434 stop:814 length:381 start_codon:yes stop_codon:yes gene_type:complete